MSNDSMNRRAAMAEAAEGKQTTPFVCDPANSAGYEPGESRTASKYRQHHPTAVWCFNPWTSQARDECDIMLDPYGHAIDPPGEPLHIDRRQPAPDFAEHIAALPKPAASALDVQVGGDHYKKWKIQPIEYIHANNIPFPEGCVIKYVSRWRDKGGIKDLEKAKHFIDLIIELESRT